MNRAENQIEQIYLFLQESVKDHSGITDARRRLRESLSEPDHSGSLHYENVDDFYLSAAWMLPAGRCGGYEIPADLRYAWNRFVLRLLSPASQYHYTDQDRYLADLADLSRRFEKIVDMESKAVSGPYRLQERTTPVSPRFTGRESLLNSIHQKLNTGSKVLVLYGMGGIGKSEVAKAYVNRYASSYQTIVFCYFHENLQETVIDDSQISVQHLHFQSSGKRGERGWYFRRKLDILQQIVDERTLLVIDNFDVLSDERLHAVTALPCRILFTSRTAPSAFSLPGIHIPALSPAMQEQLFYAYYGDTLPPSELPQLEKLLLFLNGHTLSIKLCASYLAESGETISSLLAVLQENTPPAPGDDSSLNAQIRHIFRISALGKEERAILRFLSVMPLYGIPVQKFIDWCRIKNTDKIEKLITRGLIEWNEQDGVLSLHPLISRTVRQTEKVSFRNCYPYTQTLCILSHQSWSKTAEEKKEFESYVYTLVLTLMDTEKEPFDDLVFLMSGCWLTGYYSLAEELGFSLYRHCRKKYAEDSTETANIRYRIGVMYDNWEKEETAAQWFRLAYHGYKNCKHPQLYYYAVICHKYGKIFRYEKKYEEAEQVLLDAQSYLSRELKKDPAAADIGYVKGIGAGALLDIYMELAVLYLEWGRPRTALVWIRRRAQEYSSDLDQAKKASEWHVDYITGRCHTALGNYDDAEAALSSSLAFTKTYFIEENHYTCMVLDALGELMMKKGDEKAAGEYFHQKQILKRKIAERAGEHHASE